MMRHQGLLVLALVAGCVASDESLSLSEAEQAEWDGGPDDLEGETIVIEGGFDACWDAGLCWPGGSGPESPVDPGDTGDGYGGGGGPGPGGPKKPQRKDCTAEEDFEACTQCCWYNYDRVDGYDCRKKPDPVTRALCWQSIFPAYVACVLYCKRRDDPGILTGSLPGSLPGKYAP